MTRTPMHDALHGRYTSLVKHCVHLQYPGDPGRHQRAVDLVRHPASLLTPKALSFCVALDVKLCPWRRCKHTKPVHCCFYLHASSSCCIRCMHERNRRSDQPYKTCDLQPQAPTCVEMTGTRGSACARRYRNQDGVAVYSDTALFQRNTAACPNKLKPNNTPVPSTGKSGLLGNVSGLLHPTLPPAVATHLNNFENNLTTAVASSPLSGLLLAR